MILMRRPWAISAASSRSEAAKQRDAWRAQFVRHQRERRRLGGGRIASESVAGLARTTYAIPLPRGASLPSRFLRFVRHGLNLVTSEA